MAIDLSKLSVKELKELAAQAERQAAAKAKQEREDVKAELVALAHERGYDLYELVGTKAPRGSKTAAPKSEPTHRDPENPENVWRGRGPRPEWLNNYIADGRSAEDFRI